MKLKDILQRKGTDVLSISSHASLQDVVAMLVQSNYGSLLVVDEGELRGIITERDILRAAAVASRPLTDCVVQDHMSVDLLVGKLDDTLSDAMGWMTEHRVRHLPVIQEEELVGIVSIGDLVKAQHDHLSMENHYLKNYIQS